MAGESRRARALFMAFGTKGDVLPIAVSTLIINDLSFFSYLSFTPIQSMQAIADALARDQLQYQVLFITHLAHRSISDRLEGIGVSFVPISSPPVVPAAVLDGMLLFF